MKNLTRREFVKMTGSLVSSSVLLTAGYSPTNKRHEPAQILGHGDFKYRVNMSWGALDPASTPVNNCHEMVMDKSNRLIMITDDVRNNIIIYDRSGKLLKTWGNKYPGGHGLTLFPEGETEVLFICDYKLGKVVKTTLDGLEILTLPHPADLGIYEKDQAYKPTETAVASNGDIYVTDGYGSQYVIQFDRHGNYIRHFGGKGDTDATFDTCHGICIDERTPDNPTLLITSRGHNAFKRFTLDGEYLSTIYLPGAFVCRPVIDEENIYSGVCWSRLKYLNRTPQSGFITILNKKDRVISNPGGSKPHYRHGELQLMVQQEQVFQHCHDVCVDNDKNLYVCQWNAGSSYPIMLERI